METVKVVEHGVESACEVLAHSPISPQTRVLVRYDGIPIFADLNQGQWELTGTPAADEEKALLDSFTELGTTVTATDPSGATTTFKD